MALARRLNGLGVALAGTPEEATHIVVNTCGFIREAKEESIGAILEAVSGYPQAAVIVVGCLVERYREELAAGIPEVAGWFGVGETEAFLRTLVGRAQSEAPGEQGGPESPLAPRGAYGYVKISDGCDHRCSFCAIPSFKGPYAALPPAEILTQAEAYLAAGVRELVLVGQDTAVYEHDGVDLPALVDLLAQDERVRWIRLMYLQPEHVGDRLLRLIADHPKVVPYLDIPFQHAARPVLARMARRGEGKEYGALLEKARKLMPEVSVRSTFIVGFPGETEDDFQELVEFVRRVGFDHAGVFVYSPEEGTPAARLRPRVRTAVARERLARLSDILASSAEAANRGRIGTRVEVLIDFVGQGDGPEGVKAVGRTYRQAPEVDGVTFLEGDLPPGAGRGHLLPAVVTEALGYDLVARWDAAQPS